MLRSNLKSLIGKLNSTCRNALESAAGLCLSQTHYEVDLEHFFIKLLEVANTDFQKILRHFEINETRLLADFTRAMEGFKTGNARTPALSPRIPKMIEEAWVAASVDFEAPLVRSGHIILALMANEEMARMLTGSSELLKKISVETLTEHLNELTAGSKEEADAGKMARSAEAPGAPMVPAGTKTLDQYTINLTDRARKGEIDPVLGRDFEIRQMVDILIRRRQNNPILTGEAGVGKTAVVEGLALRIVEGDIPPPLRSVEIRTLDLGLLQAGAGIKGEFENRLKSVINEVKASPIPIILFIDEAHTMIGAGGAAGSGRCGQPAQAGAGPRRTAHHRRHHLVGVQEILRKGCGPGPPVPGGQDRGTRRSERRGHDAGHRTVSGKAPPGDDYRRSPGGFGAALAPLSHRPAAPGQVRERPRYRLRPRGHWPQHQPAGGGGSHPPDRPNRAGDLPSWSGKRSWAATMVNASRPSTLRRNPPRRGSKT